MEVVGDGWMEMVGDRWTKGWLDGQMRLGWPAAWRWMALAVQVPHPNGIAGDPHLVGQRDDFRVLQIIVILLPIRDHNEDLVGVFSGPSGTAEHLRPVPGKDEGRPSPHGRWEAGGRSRVVEVEDGTHRTFQMAVAVRVELWRWRTCFSSAMGSRDLRKVLKSKWFKTISENWERANLGGGGGRRQGRGNVDTHRWGHDHHGSSHPMAKRAKQPKSSSVARSLTQRQRRQTPPPPR